jgi:hypothetical protein
MVNATQMVGIFFFALSTLLCLRAGKERGWKIIALMQFLFAAEIFLGLRHRLHNIIVAKMEADAMYAGRSGWQFILLFVVVALLLLGWWIGVSKSKGDVLHLKIARGAVVLVLLIFSIESVSLHITDKILYRPVGHILLIGWLWTLFATITGISAILSRRG